MHSVVHPNRRLSSKLGQDPSLSAFYHVSWNMSITLAYFINNHKSRLVLWSHVSCLSRCCQNVCGDPLFKFTTLTLFLYCLLAVSLSRTIISFSFSFSFMTLSLSSHLCALALSKIFKTFQPYLACFDWSCCWHRTYVNFVQHGSSVDYVHMCGTCRLDLCWLVFFFFFSSILFSILQKSVTADWPELAMTLWWICMLRFIYTVLHVHCTQSPNCWIQ